MTPKIPIDALIDAGWIVPVEPDGLVLANHSVAVRDGRILALLPTPEAHALYAAERHHALPGHVLIPGLINLHAHAAMNLLRGLADDLPLMEWLNDHIWPAEGKFVSAEFVRDGTLLACAEMLRGGVTCFNDMYFFPEAAARAALAAKMRAVVGIIVIEFPTAYAADPDDYLHKGLVTRDALMGEDLISFCLAPHAPYTIGDETFAKVLTYAEQLDLPIHIHVQETADEISGSQAQYGLRPLQRLRNLGLVGPNLLAVHAVHLTPEEIATLGAHGCSVAHCPSSNLKLASGIAPVAGLLEHGVNVGLGTDGAASNNRLDVLGEMRLAALLAKGTSGRADTLPAHLALRMATLNGARAMGLEDRIGSIIPGKAADLTAVDLRSLETAPCYDVVSHLVYAAGRENVSHVWVNGEQVVDEGRLTTLDVEELRLRAARWRRKIENG